MLQGVDQTSVSTPRHEDGAIGRKHDERLAHFELFLGTLKKTTTPPLVAFQNFRTFVFTSVPVVTDTTNFWRGCSMNGIYSCGGDVDDKRGKNRPVSFM